MAKKIPSTKTRFPIVGVGASAGGLAAFQEFFSGLTAPDKPGMAFVLVQHLHPAHKSLLVELIRGFTALKVFTATDRMKILPNSVYVIPPAHQLTVENGALRVSDRATPRGIPLPIDVFFRSLAEDQGAFAVAVVLSGTGSDGTLGLKNFRQAGGLVLSQDVESAEFDGMPGSAARSSQVDFVLPASQMIAKIRDHFLPSDEIVPMDESIPAWDEATLQKVFSLLHNQTKHDFSNYKPNTIQRRIERRIAAKHAATLSDYLGLLKASPEEVKVLFADLLIGVTSFFRDPKVFKVLAEKIIPKVIEGHHSDAPVRVWSAGCSTGEEAYSLAILLQEGLEALAVSKAVQIFASDIDGKSIAMARTGNYPASIAKDIMPSRLKRFFTADEDQANYKVQKLIRDFVIFSEHDLNRDPPFFKLDLLVCRNLMIYFNADLQKKLIPMFHYALNPGGFLVLGPSETIGDFNHLFEAVDRADKIYVRREAASTYPRSAARFLRISSAFPVTESTLAAKGPQISKVSLRSLTEQTLLKVLEMAAALVNAQGDVLYLHGKVGSFLEPTQGESGNNNILKMAKDGLKYPMATALHQAVEEKTDVSVSDLKVWWRKELILVSLGVHPVDQTASDPAGPPLFLVVMEEQVVHETDRMPAESFEKSFDQRLEMFKKELAAKEEHLEDTNEEMEVFNEELRATNEELQSVNEELQSSNEEMETSKEELQSVNEELITVNAELNSKVGELTRSNNDMNNLLGASGIATVFVDFKLNILRFTPEATRVINLIPSDVGRPVGHLVSNLIDYQSLEQDTRSVLDTLVPKELEVRSKREAWYLLRIQPYRTIDNIIEGAVISFVDITELAQHREALQRSGELLRLVSIVQDSRDAIIVQDLDGRILAWNQGATDRYGWSVPEALNMNIRDQIPKERQAEAVELIRRLSLANVPETYKTQRLTKDGKILDVALTVSTLMTKAGEVHAISIIEKARG